MMHACIFLFLNRYSPIKVLLQGLFIAFYGWVSLVTGIVYGSCTDPALIPVLITFSQNRAKPPPAQRFAVFPAYGFPFSCQNQNVPIVKNTAPHFVTLKLIMQLEQISKSTASRYINLAAQHYEKQEHQRLSFPEYTEYYGWEYCTAMRRLGFDCVTPQKLAA